MLNDARALEETTYDALSAVGRSAQALGRDSSSSMDNMYERHGT